MSTLMQPSLAGLTGLVTYEFENVPSAAVDWLAAHGVEVAPGARARFQRTAEGWHGFGFS